tara:strand:- start:870 stop:1211 length:342 start_codon:yes stop_codon:yes gene_type:complete
MQSEETVFKMYIKETCPYCVKARDYVMKELGASLHTIEVSKDSNLRQMIIEDTGQTTVPVVFLGNTFIGGCDDLIKFGQSSEGRIQILHREVDILRAQYNRIHLQIEKLVRSQ